jgi:hypothetical protein
MVESVNKVYLPNGEYKGVITGWGVYIHFNQDFYYFMTNKGVKGSCGCDVIIKDFKATIDI